VCTWTGGRGLRILGDESPRMHDDGGVAERSSVAGLQLSRPRAAAGGGLCQMGLKPRSGGGRSSRLEGTFDAASRDDREGRWERPRLATLRDLGARSPEQRNAEVACRDAAEVCTVNPLDIPCAAIYLLDEEGTRARRVRRNQTMPD